MIEGLRKVLPELCVRKGIKDSDPFVEKYKGAFVLLMRHGWIDKRLGPSDGKLVWHLSEPVVEFLQMAQSPPFKILPSEALEAMFTEVRALAPGEAESIYGPILRRMEGMIATWRAGLPEVVDLVERSSQKVRAIDVKCRLEGNVSSADVSHETRTSVTLLVQAITSVVLGPNFSPSNVLETFKDLWCAPENFDSIVDVSQRATSFDPSKPENYGLFLRHAQALSDLCELLTAVIRGEAVCRLAGRKLTAAESERMHTARMAFLSQQYQSAVEKIGELVEGKIRDVGFTAMRALWGERAQTVLPVDVRDHLKEPRRGHPRAKRPSDRNFLFDVSRSEYSKIIFNREVRRALFEGLVSGEESDELKNQMELLFSLADRDAHIDHPTYFREHATEIGTALQVCPRMCDLFNQLATRLVEGNDFKIERKADCIEFRFTQSQPLASSHRLSGPEIETLVKAALDRLEGGDFFIPPFEAPLLSIHNNPETALGILRACKEQDLVSINPLPAMFGYRASMTEKGRERLTRLRSGGTKGP
jgi:hypothetical protein